MDEDSRHRFEKKSGHKTNEAEVVIEKCGSMPCDELEELCPVVELIKTPPEEVPEGKWEKIRDHILREAEEHHCDFITTLKDRITTTDSIVFKGLLYLIVIFALLAIGAGAYLAFD